MFWYMIAALAVLLQLSNMLTVARLTPRMVRAGRVQLSYSLLRLAERIDPRPIHVELTRMEVAA